MGQKGFSAVGSLFSDRLLVFVIPAQAGIQDVWTLLLSLDPGLRRDDGCMSFKGV